VLGRRQECDVVDLLAGLAEALGRPVPERAAIFGEEEEAAFGLEEMDCGAAYDLEQFVETEGRGQGEADVGRNAMLALDELARLGAQVEGVEGKGGLLGEHDEEVNAFQVGVAIVDAHGARPPPAGAGAEKAPAGGANRLQERGVRGALGGKLEMLAAAPGALPEARCQAHGALAPRKADTSGHLRGEDGWTLLLPPDGRGGVGELEGGIEEGAGNAPGAGGGLDGGYVGERLGERTGGDGLTIRGMLVGDGFAGCRPKGAGETQD